MQADPNASGQTVMETRSHSGRQTSKTAAELDMEGRLGNGLNLYQYMGSDSWIRQDPLGLSWGDAATSLLPGPGDFITGMLESVVSEYSANLDWDVEWAGDSSAADDLHSRTDDKWVVMAMLRGLYDSFEIGIPFTDYRYNPMDAFASGATRSSTPTKGRRSISIGGGRSAHFSKTLQIDEFKIHKFKHPDYPYPVIKFGSTSPVRRTHTIAPQGSGQADTRQANKDLKKPADYDWSQEYGEPMTWHHSLQRGKLELVPRRIHNATKPHTGGAKIWYD